MELTVFKLSSKHMQGFIYLGYEEQLTQLQMELREPLTPEQWSYLRQRLPLTREEIPQLSEGNGLKIDELKPKSVQDKLVAFGMAYKHYRKINYIHKETEKANLKPVPVTRELLHAFFTSNAWFVQNNYTLTNYIKRINNLKDLLANGQYVKPRFPDKYDQAFERSLTDPQELSAYHQHLRSLGFSKKNGRYCRSVGEININL